MTEYYFSDPEARRRLAVELESWLGTPFRHHCGVKGLGADCIHFVARIVEAVCPDHPPLFVFEYPRDWHRHRDEELLYQGIKEQLRAEEVGFHDPMAGDIILFQFGRTMSHASFHFEGMLYHALNNMGVVKIDWTDRMWSRRKRTGFRLVK